MDVRGQLIPVERAARCVGTCSVLKELVAEKRPRLVRHMEQEGVDLTLITFNWFLSIYVDCVPPEVFAQPNARIPFPARCAYT